MNRRFQNWLFCAVLTLGLGVSTAHASLNFSPFVASTGGSPIGFAYAGDKFVGSNYYNNQLYQTDLNGANVSSFGAALPLASGAVGEIYVSSSLGLGGFGSRDVFAGSQTYGIVYKFNNDGTGQTAFVTGLDAGVRSIAFDPYGVYGYKMIVATMNGKIWSVDSTGSATLLANTGEDTEGLSFAPQIFGSVPFGTLVVASESSGSLRAVAPDGSLTLLTTINGAEMVSFVPLNLGISGNPLEGFYAANYSVNVIKSSASNFSAYLGHMIVTGEYDHKVWDVSWNGANYASTLIDYFPNQPEDGIFVTAAILNPGCDVTNTCGGNGVPEPATVALIGIGMLGFVASRRKGGRSAEVN